MNTVKISVRALKWSLRIVICAWVPLVGAFTQEITARYSPEPGGTSSNKFTNITPVRGVCAISGGFYCDSNNYSVTVPIDFNSTAALVADHPSERQGAMFKVPAQWREVTVYHRESGSQEKVKIKISGIGATYVTPDVRELTGGYGHSYLWRGGGWGIAAKPCLDSRYYKETATTYDFFWKTPVDAVCAKTARFDIPFLRYQNLSIAYELITPNPLGMSQGTYTGTLNYRIGPGGDFDMGDVMRPSDESLTFNFTLYVGHVLKVELPPGGERVELVPEGGWQAWLQNPARIPKKLFRDQTFNILSSGPFTMNLKCKYYMGDDCQIRNAHHQGIPVQVGVSFPNGFTDANGGPVVRQRIKTTAKALFVPSGSMIRRPATLHFEINKKIDEALRDHPGTTYSGAITVVLDSEV